MPPWSRTAPPTKKTSTNPGVHVRPSAYPRGFYRYATLSEDPVVVGGCERSGTTLLHAVLSAHPSILAIPYETWGLCWGPFVKKGARRRFRLTRLWRGMGVAPRLPTHDRWAEKSPANVFYFGEILERFRGRVRLIQCVRDGRDVVTSIHPARGKPWVPIPRWIEAVRAGLAYQSHPDVHTVRYEDLVTRPAETMASLYRFLGLGVEGEDAESRRSWLLGWRDRATIRSSRNLRDGEIGPITRASVRKWERPDFEYAGRVQELERTSVARELLEIHGYLSRPPDSWARRASPTRRGRARRD